MIPYVVRIPAVAQAASRAFTDVQVKLLGQYHLKVISGVSTAAGDEYDDVAGDKDSDAEMLMMTSMVVVVMAEQFIVQDDGGSKHY